MNQPCIAIGGIGGNVASAIARCIKKNDLDVFLIGYDMDVYSYGKMYVDEFIVAPPMKEENKYIAFLNNMCEKHAVTHIWPVSEDEIKILQKYRRHFEDKSVQLMMNSDEVLQIGFSKWKTHVFLKGISLDKASSPETGLANLDYIPIDYPIVLKKDFGNGSHGLMIANNKEEYIKCVQKYNDMVYQKYVGNDEEEYTMPIFAYRDIIRSCPLKRKLGLDGMSVRVETVNDSEFQILNAVAIKIATVMKLSGCIDVQLRKENGLFYIIEINTRISSSVGFRALLGFEDAIWWIQSKINKPISEYKKVKSKMVGKKVLEEVIFTEDGHINAGFGSKQI